MGWVECELWSYWGDPTPMGMIVKLPIVPMEGDDINVGDKRYTVMRRRIAHLEPLRLYVALDEDEHQPIPETPRLRAIRGGR